MQANAAATTFFTLALPPGMYADIASAAFSTLAFVSSVCAEAAAATLFARVLDPPVWAHTAFTLFAVALDPPMAAYGGSTALCALAPKFFVLTLRSLADTPVAGVARFRRVR
jgi:hypothetical protein